MQSAYAFVVHGLDGIFGSVGDASRVRSDYWIWSEYDASEMDDTIPFFGECGRGAWDGGCHASTLEEFA